MNLSQVYCDMELSCDGRDGGWMRIGNIKDGDTCPMHGNSYHLQCKHVEPIAIMRDAIQLY